MMKKKYMAALKIFEDSRKLFEELDLAELRQAEIQLHKGLYAIQLKEDYGIEAVNANMVKSGPPNVYVDMRTAMYVDMCICSMGEKYNRTISWPEGGGQPDDEVLFMLGFPTGPLMFSDSYPQEFFDEFWCEIKSYEYKYIDEHNRCIYFELKKAAPIANAFPAMLKKYYERYRDEADTRRIAELKQELERLEANA
ncbi:hypothetical protein LJC49_09635 [Ruminococcaceae bacterium OttesenSCG-928-I18]|nr:hypothetical protein [Ruminococcaceae bacterium OttesenSCG-928-I18]